MERRQRWLEGQFRKHDDCLSKIAKQLQVLQDFITLNFDSYQQYAVEREREERINHLTYGHIDKPNHSGYPHLDSPQHAHNPQYTSRLTPIPGPDSYIRHAPSLPPSTNMESDYEDGDTMDPAQEDQDQATSNPHSGVVVDLSTPERRRYPFQQQQQQQQQQEPNSTTVSDYAVAAYYGLTARDEITLPDSAFVEEGPTDLSTSEKKIDRDLHTYQTGAVAQGSILGGILTSNIPPKIKVEIREDDDINQCYSSYPRSRTDSTDSTSKDKEYSSQALWSAGTVTTITTASNGVGCGPGSTCSADETQEHVPPPPPRHRPKGRPRKERNPEQLQQFLMKKEGKKRRGSANDDRVASSSTASLSNQSPTTSNSSCSETTSTTGRKGASSKDSNASKQCRFCGKTFQWLHSVKTHERLHTGIKPYACKICGARFTQNGNLKVHAKTCVEKHAESYRARNVLICSVCTEMFSDADALMDHQKSHDRMQWTIKEKTCQLCGEVFQKRSFLLEHEKVHVQDKTFLSSLGIEAEVKSGTALASSSPPISTSTISGNGDNEK